MNRHQQLGILFVIFAPVLILWAFLTPIALIAAEDWPVDGPEWRAFFIVVGLVTVFTAMARVAVLYVRGPDWLAISFSAFSVSLALLFLWIIGLRLWPSLLLKHPNRLRSYTDIFYMSIGIASLWFLYHLSKAVIDGELRRRLARDENTYPRRDDPVLSDSYVVVWVCIIALAVGSAIGLAILKWG